MIKIMKYGQVPSSEIFARVSPTVDVAGIVADILYDVRKNGDKAVLAYCAKFDKAELTTLEVSKEEIEEALNLVAIAQSAPGVVAANAAISMGYKLGGIRGTLTALLATILPPLITLSIISYAYDAFAHNQYIQLVLKGMQCGATAIIINVAIDLLKKELKKKLALPLLIIVGTFIANYFFNVNLMYAVVVDAVIGFFLLRDKKYA